VLWPTIAFTIGNIHSRKRYLIL